MTPQEKAQAAQAAIQALDSLSLLEPLLQLTDDRPMRPTLAQYDRVVRETIETLLDVAEGKG